MRFLVYILILISLNASGQGEVSNLFEDLPNDSIPERSIKSHTSLKPLIRQTATNVEVKSYAEVKSYIRLTGLGDLNYIQNERTDFKTGIGAELRGGAKDKFFFRIAGVQGISQTDSIFRPKTYLSDSIGQFSAYTDLRGRISYTPNHIFNFQAGLDHNFIGEGSRSMLLSDYGTPYPFGQIRMRFWRIEYSVLYQFMREKDNNRWEGKFVSSHHLSFNAAKWLNFGLFETVIFQPKDTLLNRGFDAEYLNPFIFYRPQEYSVGSSDNVLLGVELNAYWKAHTLYGQFILDEFFLAEIKAKSGWWANKYGGQFGIKGRFSNGENNFFYRLEYNFARPYTYSHLSEELNYGNQGTTLTHPYGSNFMEILGEIKWQRKKLFAKIFANYFLRGADKDGFNYGGNIYESYVNRPFEYGHYIGQGRGFNGTKTVISFGYQLLEHGKLTAFAENHFAYNTLDKVGYTLVIGVRSMLWNDHRNY